MPRAFEQFVVEGEIKLAAARIALTSGSANELAVDAAGFVALRADDVQAPGPNHCLAFLLDLLADFDLFNGAPPDVERHFEPAGIMILELGPGEEFGIAAQEDVGAAAGHVRGDGDGAAAAGLGDDLRLLAMSCRGGR